MDNIKEVSLKDNSKQNNDIINLIMSNGSRTKQEVLAQQESNKTLIDQKTFFTDNFQEGIISKEEFKNTLHSSAEPQLKAINSLLNAMKEKRKINTSEFSYTDKKGQDYYFIKLYGSNGNSDFKIIVFPGLEKLLHGYLFDLLNVQVTLEGLYEELITE